MSIQPHAAHVPLAKRPPASVFMGTAETSLWMTYYVALDHKFRDIDENQHAQVYHRYAAFAWRRETKENISCT